MQLDQNRISVKDFYIMSHRSILSATLGLPSYWHVTEAQMSEESQRIDLRVTVVPGWRFKCPCCGCDCQTTKETEETWYHDSFLNLRAYLVAQIPSINCPKGCGLHRIVPPWERPGSKFRRISDNPLPEK
jgi:hypothetical protein